MVAPPQGARLWLLLALFFPSSAGVPQTKPPRSVRPFVIRLPRVGVTRIPSPDGKWTLMFEMPSGDSTRKLWIRRNGSTERTLVRDFERSLECFVVT